MLGTASDGQSYVRLKTDVTTTQRFTALPTDYTSFGYSGDVFFFCGAAALNTAILSDPMRCIDVIDCSNDAEDSVAPGVLDLKGSKPAKLLWSAKDDWDRYGSVIGGIKSAMAFRPGTFPSENGVIHDSYQGDIIDLIDWEYHEQPDGSFFSWGGIDVPHWGNTGAAFGRERNFLSPSGFAGNGLLSFTEGVPLSTYPEGGFDMDAWEVAVLLHDHLRSGGEVSYGASYWRFLIRGYAGEIERGLNRMHISHSYEYEMRYGTGPYVTAKFAVTRDVTFRYSAVGGSAALFSSHRINQSCFTVDQNSSVSLVSLDYPHDLVPSVVITDVIAPTILWGDEFGFVPTQLLTSPYQVDYTAISNFESYRRYHSTDRDKRHKTLRSWMSSHLSDVRPSSFYSSANAIEEHFGVIKANNLENLSQLSGILSLLPNLSDVRRIAAKATNGDLSAVLDLVDLLSEALLVYRFGQAPTVKDAKEILLTDIRKEVKSLMSSRTVTLYGKFDYTFPWEHNFTGDFGSRLVLETRSKICISYDSSTLMAGILAANSVGLLPTLSRIWEILPFSFVVDWLTNMSSRLKYIDDQVSFVAVCDVHWALHSYALTYYPSADELERYNLSTTSQKPFGIRCYTREFTKYTPVLRESRYDFLGVQGLPNLATVGALLWQII